MTTEEILINEELTIIDFYAEWCNPCKQMSKYLEEIEKEVPDIHIIKVDSEEEVGLVFEYKVRNLPTLVFIKDKEIKERIVGAISKERIEALIQLYK